MFEYYLYLYDDEVEIEEQFFKDLISLYSTKFGIWKFNTNMESYCESEMIPDEPLFYYLRDTEKNRLILFAKVYKILNK